MTSRIMSALHGSAAEPALKRLRNKLLAVNVISLTLVIAVSFSIIYFNFYNRTQSDIDNALLSIPRGVLENVMLSQQSGGAANANSPSSADAPPGGQITISGEPRIPVDYTKSFVANIASDGSITVFSMLDMDNDTYLGAIEAALEESASSGSVSIADRAWRFSIEQSATSFTPYKYSIVFLDIQDANRGVNALAASLFVIGIIAVGAIFLISLFAANRAIRPVEASMIRQRRFVADASHELKTPIAVIAANAEAANDAAYEVEKWAAETGNEGEVAGISRWIGNIADEATRMGELVESMLKLAKAEEKQADLVVFDLVGAVCEEADRVEAFLFEKDISFDFELKAPETEQVTICSDRSKVQAAISVLLENAVKYTPEKGRVTMTVCKGNGNGNGGTKATNNASVSVSNTGPYIPPEDLAQIFDRFFRADPSRSSETGGHGIGLSIAKEIARTLGGELTAASVQDETGEAVNTFTLYL